MLSNYISGIEKGILGFCLVFCLLSFQVNQDPFKAIVLINGQPYIVDLAENGSILNRYQKVADYFTSSASDEAIIERARKTGLIATPGLNFYDVGEDPIAVRSSELLKKEQFIQFSLSRAVLTKEAVDQVRKLSDAYQEGRFIKLTINSFHDNSGKSATLARNRAEAIRDLLHTFGVPLQQIAIEMEVVTDGSDLSFVNLSFAQ